MKYDIQIYGVHSRDELIQNYFKSFPFIHPEDIIYEDRPNGGKCIYSVEKALQRPVPPGITHRIVFPDDIIVCDNFLDIAQEMIETHPHCIIGLFPYDADRNNGDGKIMERVKDSPYYESIILSGCGVIFPIEIIDKMLSDLHKEYGDDFYNQIDDIIIQKWARKNNIKVISPIPSPVQHVGDVSLLTPGLFMRRTAFYKEHIEGINWRNKKINKQPLQPNFMRDLIIKYGAK